MVRSNQGRSLQLSERCEAPRRVCQERRIRLPLRCCAGVSLLGVRRTCSVQRPRRLTGPARGRPRRRRRAPPPPPQRCAANSRSDCSPRACARGAVLLLCAARLPVKYRVTHTHTDSLDIASACRRSQGAAVRGGRGVPQSLRGGGAARGARAVVSVLLLACVSAAAACASGEGDTYAGGEVRARARTAPPRTILPVWYLCTLVSWSPPKCMCAA